MENIVNILETIFFLLSAVWGYLFYAGRLNYSGDKEIIRRKRVEKYKWLFIISIIVLFVSGIGMLMDTLKKIIP